MAKATLDGARIIDWQTFHTECAREFGFPDFYWRNGNAWIDCLTYIDEEDPMCRFVLQPQEVLTVETINSDVVRCQAPDVLTGLVAMGSIRELSFRRTWKDPAIATRVVA